MGKGSRKAKKKITARQFLGKSKKRVWASPFETPERRVFCKENRRWYTTEAKMRNSLKQSAIMKRLHSKRKKKVRSLVTGKFYESIFVRRRAENDQFILAQTEYGNQMIAESSLNQNARVHLIKRTMMDSKGKQSIEFVKTKREVSCGVVCG